MAAARKKTRARVNELPTYEVDVDDEHAIAAVAEALVGAILSAAAGRSTKTKHANAKRKAKKTAKKGARAPRRAR